MLDLNILKWSWSQRFILISYIFTFYFTITKPYAQLNGEFSAKQFKSTRNLICWATVISLLIACSYCFGMYRLKFKRFIYISLGCVGANLFFLLVSFAKDKRIPTWSFLFGVICLLITCGLIWYDSKLYRYYNK